MKEDNNKKFYNFKDSYNYYKKEKENPVNEKVYMNILSMYMKYLIEKILEGCIISFPKKLGNVYIVGNKENIKIEEGCIKGLSPDWKKTNELWGQFPEEKTKKTIIYNLNEHTGGIRYKYMWNKKKVVLNYITLYSLKITRENKRKLVRKIKEDKKEYISYNRNN